MPKDNWLRLFDAEPSSGPYLELPVPEPPEPVEFEYDLDPSSGEFRGCEVVQVVVVGLGVLEGEVADGEAS